ncbi:uncharacterized protein LOC124924361 [Impatiens glandulifera]|uniref:uncharacterized protein LOC124924361 n=2 Tax=Impatiens glandulifera TaxID=253017 RepID=UPI001FB11B53|nr:uncharacterized protein LOC124924361 [Impatiens glandulifera]
MHTSYGLTLTYNKAWRSREKALMAVRGTVEDSYGELPSYLFMLQKKNPGCCRPVLCIDASFLKHKVGGQLLVAIALDANEQLYPVAFGVVDSENNNSWTYFMQQLRLAIGSVPDLVFISDRHPSIANALSAFHVHDGEFDFQVDFKGRTCTCRVFDVSGLPCTHALAAARFRKSVPYELCARFYSTESWCMAYAETCYPVFQHNEAWDIPEHIKKRVCLKPPVKIKKGRPTTKRRSSQGEVRKERRRCGSCGGLGHNRATCSAVMPAPSTARPSQSSAQSTQPSQSSAQSLA